MGCTVLLNRYQEIQSLNQAGVYVTDDNLDIHLLKWETIMQRVCYE